MHPTAARWDPVGMSDEWWRNAVVYQIYPRAFADANGDGIGDLAGIAAHADYLAQLGVDAVWLSPFYPSALADGGYDVDDYRNVDPRLGTLADFDAMVAALHSRGVKVVVDIVPNHSSNRHGWFVEAIEAGPGSPARERYIFRDGVGDGPPNDWQSGFGGSAWQQVEDGQWYFHYFATEQPDLNWDHPDVGADFLTTLRFWADRGVDGFRVDVAHGLVKDMSQSHRPWAELGEPETSDGTHPLWDRPGVQDIYRSWRKLFDEYDPPRFAVAEAAVRPDRRAPYAAADSLGQAFNFQMQQADWDVEIYRRVITAGVADVEAFGSSTWLLGCHDTVRVATRYGLPRVLGKTGHDVGQEWLLTDGVTPSVDRALGERRARAAIMVLLALPGSTYIYQGDELGLHEVADLPPEWVADPFAARSGGRYKGRDGCRVPLPWTTAGPSFGFGCVPAQPPQPAWFGSSSVAAQDGVAGSSLELYRARCGCAASWPTGRGSPGSTRPPTCCASPVQAGGRSSRTSARNR